MQTDVRPTDSPESAVASRIEALYEHCRTNAPNYGVQADAFAASLERSLARFAAADPDNPPTEQEKLDFLGQIQCEDLFLALACAAGNERAWWDFDQDYRSYLVRVANHLARTEMDASEVVDQVYADLYGHKIVDGERVSKFSTYSGRGSLRGWLRTVVWHSLVDMHRAGQEAVSLDELTENLGEGAAHAAVAADSGGETAMLDEITRGRYREATRLALSTAFGSLEDHEKLLLLYYHVENLKLREIARLVENESSPLRGWFQRRHDRDGGSRTHESTVMRWLEKCYGRVLSNFHAELREGRAMSDHEVEICLQLATEDLGGGGIFRDLAS